MVDTSAANTRQRIGRGTRVRIRSAEEIAATLTDGELARLPFMPEMLPFLGQVHEVSARADKTCDTVNLTGTSRGLSSTVHIGDLRCDGSAHGGCQAGCLLFFREEWLEVLPTDDSEPAAVAPAADAETRLHDLTTAVTNPQPGVWHCQATALPAATHQLRGAWLHYLDDIRTRNAPAGLIARSLRISLADRYQAFSRHRLPRWALVRGGEEQPVVRGTLRRTPTESLDLQPGELVEVKSLPEIVATLDTNQRNRNLWFDREMVRYCGQQLRVVRRVDRLLDEKTGEMIETKTPSLILEGAVCVGDFHKLCPRRDYAFFREIWLKRVNPPTDDTNGQPT